MIDDDPITNRSELIKKARESCNRSLSDDNTYSSNYKLFRRPRADNVNIGEDVLKVKFFVIRFVIAAVILLSIIFVDKLEITYKNFSSNQIAEMLHSNNLYNMAKGYADKIFTSNNKEDEVKNKEDSEDKDKTEKDMTEEDETKEDKEDETKEVLNVEEQ